MKKVLSIFAIVVLISSCSITTGLTATGNSVKSATKTGTSTATLLFGILPLGGDASIATAAKNGDIDKIATVDVKTTNILFILTKVQTKVTGQNP
jgi:PBP1b-binding outer membrane lipoprotein LpoB